MTNINIELFKRYQPKKKLEIVEKMSTNELFGITPETIKRIIKEAGDGYLHSRNKSLRLSTEHHTGNRWNSTIESWDFYGGKLYVTFYVQYENTDTSTSIFAERFIRRGDFDGEMVRDDYRGNPRTYYYRYDEGDKARAIRALLLEYVHTKYADKL